MADREYIYLQPRGLAHHLTLRPSPHSDESLFQQIFVAQHYGCLKRLRPRTILDLGANIGCSPVWFSSRFPRARIVAVEPDPGNFRLLKRNCARYENIIPVQGAAWSTCRRLKLLRGRYGDGSDWATQVAVSKNGGVRGFDITALAQRLETNRIDLLKIDIECSEIELFRHRTETWLHRVRNICIELHDSECEEAFFCALAGYDYEMSQCGELTICRNLRRAQRRRECRPGELAKSR